MRIPLVASFFFLALSALPLLAYTPHYTGSVIRLDAELDALVAPEARPELLATGLAWAEGPAWRKKGGYVVFSDIPKNTIYKWSESEGLSVFLRPAGYTESNPPPLGRELGTNALLWDHHGRLVMLDQGNRRVVRLDEKNYTKVVLADRYHGKRFNSPNDLAYHSNGDLYFTDPPYGLDGLDANPHKELKFNGVYRLTAAGELHLILSDLTRPNGIALSPDEKILYVCVSDPSDARVMAYDLRPDGTVENGRVFFDANALLKQAGGKGNPDGLKLDKQGNVFLGGPGGILVITPQGKHLGTIVTGHVTANCAFGDDGSTLYIAADSTFLRIRLKTVGEGF
jgi:gluconolactonase